MREFLVILAVITASCGDDQPTPTPMPAPVASTTTASSSSSSAPAEGAASSSTDGGSTTDDGNPSANGAAGGANMRRNGRVIEKDTPTADAAPVANGESISSTVTLGGANQADSGSGGASEDPKITALREQARNPKWNEFRSVVQKQADAMVKAGIARRKARLDPTPEHQEAYDKIWPSITPLAQRVTEYQAQSRFGEDDRAVMAFITDEIFGKAMREVESAP